MKKIVVLIVILLTACGLISAFCPPPPWWCDWWGCLITPTPTHPAPSNTPHPTRVNTPVDTQPAPRTPLPTPAPTDTLAPGETPEPVRTPKPDPKPEECNMEDTGRVVQELIMHNSSLIHFGYMSGDGWTGICKIETGGELPNNAFVQQFCACQMPGFVWRTDAVITWRVMLDCHGRQFLVDEDGREGQPFGGWTFGQYCPLAGCE